MKRVVCLNALSLCALHCSYSEERGTFDTTGVAETICITSAFVLVIEYPNFLVSVLAHLAGADMDSLRPVERDIRTSFLGSFLPHLTDDDEHRWFEIASDAAFPSFIKLQLEDRTVLAPSALNFFRNSLQFLRSTARDTFHATFEYGQDTLRASVFHLFVYIDTNSLVTTLSHIETWNAKTGEEYNSAEVMAVTYDGYTALRSKY